MKNAIDKSFFFLNHQIENLQNTNIPKNTQYLLSPLLPIIAIGIFANLTINSSWLYSPLALISLILLFVLSYACYYFLKGKNIFLIHKALRTLNSSIEEYSFNNEFIPVLSNNKNLKLRSKMNSKTDTQFKTISFSDKEHNAIKQLNEALKKELISDCNKIENFIKAIKFDKLKESEKINLELPSKHCAIFIKDFFIPAVKILTNKELTLNQASRLFKYRKKNGYRSVNADSISKKHRQLSTQNQREIYKTLLDELKKVS